MSNLASRWSDEDKEEAVRIVNDIAEGIDNKETRAQLRNALAIYADWLCDEQNANAMKRDKTMVKKMTRLLKALKAQSLKPVLALLTLLLYGCSVVTMRDNQRGVTFSATMPAWPWQDSMRSIEKLNISARGTNFTASLRGLEESEQGATNLERIVEAVVSAAIKAAVKP